MQRGKANKSLIETLNQMNNNNKEKLIIGLIFSSQLKKTLFVLFIFALISVNIYL